MLNNDRSCLLNDLNRSRSEPELPVEEPKAVCLVARLGVGKGPVLIAQCLPQRLGELGPLLSSGDGLVLDILEVLEVLISDDISSWHEVIEVDELNEWLDGSPPGELLLGGTTSDSSRVASETDDEGIGELSVLVSLLIALDNECLLSGMSSGQHENHSTALKTESRKLLTSCPSLNL